MSNRLEKQYAGQGMIFDPIRGCVFDFGPTVPSDGSGGYAPGCIFLDNDASAGSQVYVNEGTITSADFNLLVGTGLSGLTASAAELNILDGATLDVSELNTLDGILATTAELNRAADVSTRVVNATASTLVVTEAAHSDKIIVLDRAAGIAVTLPAASAGLRFDFVVKTTFTGAASIKSVSGADIMIGHATMGNDSDNTTVTFQAVAANTYDTIDLFGTANSTGGIAGQRVTIWGLAANLWFVEIIGDAAGTEATPFADTVA